MAGRVDVMDWLCKTTSLLTVTIFCFVQIAMGEKCYKDDSLGDREGNVYYCESSGLPRCCIEDSLPTCCISESEKNWKEQLQLWGMVAAMIIFILILFICCKNDVSFCNSETSLKERWQNFRINTSKKGENLVNADQLGTPSRSSYYDNPIGEFDQGPRNTHDPFRYPELPGTHETKGNGYSSYA